MLIRTALLVGSCIFVSAVSAQSVATLPLIPVPSKCEFDRPHVIATSLTEVPDVASEFQRLGLVVADSGEQYRPFDVVDASNAKLPVRQFVRVYKFDGRTIAWYIKGGMGASLHIFELRALSDRQDEPEVLRATGRALGGAPCQATQALLNGVVSSQGW